MPKGADTEAHHIYGAHLEGAPNQLIGSAWICLSRSEKTTKAFIYDIKIANAHQGRGYGRQLLTLTEQKAKHLGATEVALHVFDYNDRAIKLYQSSGYKFISHSMSKTLK